MSPLTTDHTLRRTMNDLKISHVIKTYVVDTSRAQASVTRSMQILLCQTRSSFSPARKISRPSKIFVGRLIKIFFGELKPHRSEDLVISADCDCGCGRVGSTKSNVACTDLAGFQ